MDEVPEDENDCNLQVQSSEDALDRKTKPPNKKRFDEEMMDLTSQIKEKEAEMDRLKSSGVLHISKNLNSLRADRTAKITQRKEIDEQLERINNKSLPEKMKQLHQLELSLYYKSEDRINTAIQRLEWNLKAHSYKLSEEKKIVSEIDGLKRSKKTLGQYLTLKQEIGVIRDQQRHMREERDALFRSVSQIKAKEEKLKTDANLAKSSVYHLKKAIDTLYETRRSIQANFRRQKDEYIEVKERQKQEGLRRKESLLVDKRKRIAEKEAAKVPFEEEVHLCNTLIAYLGRFNTLPVSESSADSQDDPEFAEEIGDGQYILLKKSGGNEDIEPASNARKLNRRNRRSRKQSMIKQMTHTAEVLNQFLTLQLVAPATTADIGDALNKLLALKAQYEQDQTASSYAHEVASDAGISATESLICEMSRQVSKTESSEEGVGAGGSVGCGSSAGDDQIACADLLGYMGADDGTGSLPEAKFDQPEGEERGAVGGCDAEIWASQDGTGRNSDSTVEGDSGSVESQASAYDASLQISSDNVAGESGSQTCAEADPPKLTRPVLLYSEMLNLPRPETTVTPSGQKATTPSLSPRMPKHPPLSSSASSPGSFHPMTSPQYEPVGPQSQSLDSGSSKRGVQNVREESRRGNQLTVVGRNAAAIHRRSTFSGRGKEPPKSWEKSKTAVERRETFSGYRKEKSNVQGRQITSSDQNQKGNVGPWKGHEVSTGNEKALPRRPSDFLYSGNPGSSLPPLSVSWSGIASGSIKRSMYSPAAASYSSVASPQVMPSPSVPEPQSLHVEVNPALPSQLSPSNHQNRRLASRQSVPYLGEMHAQRKMPLGARASLPQMSERQTLLPSPMGNPSGLADHEQDFPPLSLSASLSSLPRRNSSNSSFSARSVSSAAAIGSFSSPHDMQHGSRDKQDLLQSQSHISKPAQSQDSNRTNGGNDSGHTKNFPVSESQEEAGSCDPSASATVASSSVKEVTLSPEQNLESLGNIVSPPVLIRGPSAAGSELASALIPTDEAFTARWIADLSSPAAAATASQSEISSEWPESTHL